MWSLSPHVTISFPLFSPPLLPLSLPFYHLFLLSFFHLQPFFIFLLQLPFQLFSSFPVTCYHLSPCFLFPFLPSAAFELTHFLLYSLLLISLPVLIFSISLFSFLFLFPLQPFFYFHHCFLSSTFILLSYFFLCPPPWITISPNLFISLMKSVFLLSSTPSSLPFFFFFPLPHI